MKISIITIVLNNVQTIADAIESVLGQTYPEIEYIVIDGMSTDGTVDILKQYNKKVSRIISEKDNGLYDAINKGIKLATGDVIGFLHSDDIFYSVESIAKIASAFNNYNTDSVYGDLLYVNKSDTNKIVRNWVSGNYKRENFLLGWMPPHPTFYVKRDVYNKLGLYNTTFKSAADYELMLRYLYRYNISTIYIPEKLVRMRIGGKSNATLRNRIQANNEDYKAWIINGLEPKFYTRYLKPVRKLLQFIYYN